MAGPVRQSINLVLLERYIDSHVPELQGPLKLKQFGFGQSNPTYQLTDATGRKSVLRKKPPGALLSPMAHQVAREYRILKALEPTDVPVPKVYCLCEDDSVIGTAFYIMEFLDGRIISDHRLSSFTPEERRLMWQDAVGTLAKLHRLNFRQVGLSNFGRADRFYERQIKTFHNLSLVQAEVTDMDTGERVGKLPYFHEMVAYFMDPKTQPRDRSTLVHGDYKLDNLVFHHTEPRVIGILDWEMATIGHPLSDVVNLLGPWAWVGQVSRSDSGQPRGDSLQTASIPGVPTSQEVTQWYAEECGYDPSTDLGWGSAFGGFRVGVIMQGIAARFARRQASGTTAAKYAGQMRPYGEWAYSLVQEQQKNAKEASGKAKI